MTKLDSTGAGRRPLSAAVRARGRNLNGTASTGAGRRLALMLGAVAAHGAAGQEAGGSNTVFKLEEVVVTANKREQALADIPLSVSTFSSDELRQRNLETFEDYLTFVPGVQFNDGGNAFAQSISIRGVTDGTGSVLTQAPVALYFDETPLTLSQGNINLDFALLGVERVTVIKGPHSSLYGAASLGGTIKVETRKPSLTESTLRGGASVASIDSGGTGYTVFASGSAPLIEGMLGVEATAYSRRRAGYIDDPSRGADDINPADVHGGRLAFRFQPLQQLVVDASLVYQDADGFQDTYSPGVGDLQSSPLVVEQRDPDEVLLGSMVAEYDFGAASLVSATSYYQRDTGFFQDLTEGPFGSPGDVVRFDFLAEAEVFSQELRLASGEGERLEWLIGGFYYNEDYQETSLINSERLGQLFGTPPGMPLTYEYTTVAVFGEVSYAITDALRLTAGGRWTNYESDVDLNISGLFGPPPGSDMVSRTDDEDVFTPRVALSYDFEQTMVYLQAARGFRQGQANSPVLVTPQDNRPAFFESDSLWNYEVGVKGRWLDGRLLANLAAYFIDWEDIQQSVRFSTGFGGVVNAGAAEIYGVEVETTALLSDRTLWTVGASYIDAETTEEVPTFAVAGAPIPGVPEFTFTTGLQQGFRLLEQDGFARLDYLYYGPFDNNFSATGGAVDENGDYHKLDLRIGLTVSKAEFQLFATNVLDERPVLTRDTFGGPERVTTIQPRTVGLAVNFEY